MCPGDEERRVGVPGLRGKRYADDDHDERDQQRPREQARELKVDDRGDHGRRRECEPCPFEGMQARAEVAVDVGDGVSTSRVPKSGSPARRKPAVASAAGGGRASPPGSLSESTGTRDEQERDDVEEVAVVNDAAAEAEVEDRHLNPEGGDRDEGEERESERSPRSGLSVVCDEPSRSRRGRAGWRSRAPTPPLVEQRAPDTAGKEFPVTVSA